MVRKEASTLLRRVIVIAGVARSGTSWLGQIFDSSPSVTYRFQPFFCHAFRGRMHEQSPSEDWRHFFRDLTESRDPFLTQASRRKSGEYAQFQKDAIADTLALKTCRFQYLLPKMLRQCPETHLVAVIRHPCAMLDSWRRNAKEFPSEAKFLEEWRVADSKNQGASSEFFGYYKWKETAHLYLDLKDQLPDRVCVVSYRNLVEETVAETQRLFARCGLTYERQTEEFVAQCHSDHQESAYAVFKSPKVLDRWKGRFPDQVQQEITEDLRGTRLEPYLA